MGYGKKVYDEAIYEINNRRANAEKSAEAIKLAFFEKSPRAMEIEKERVSCVAKIGTTILKGGNVKENVEKLRDRCKALDEEFNSLLADSGLVAEDIAPKYSCKSCSDTGFIDGKMCNCLKNLQRKIAYDKLSMNVPLKNSTFDSFSLEFYPENSQKDMSAIYNYLVKYANSFSQSSPSLLFRGGTGLGKTHLSLAISNVAIDKGFGVIYTSVYNLASALENERFDRNDDDKESTYSQMMDCDLLILDDLGAEYSSNYINSSIYNLVNTRMLAQKPTIISTNLSMQEIEKRYSERFASRLFGHFGVFTFIGDDIRYEKRKQQ